MSFVAPLFLAGLAAIALPWLLHRFSHDDPEQSSFPSTRFLEAVPPPLSRKRRIRYRVLLALRALLIGVLCLVFARPWFPSDDALLGDRQLYLLVVDRSASMQVDDRQGEALALARDWLDDIPDGGQVRAFLADDRLLEVTDGPVSAPAAKEALSTLESSNARVDFGVMMRRLDALASESQVPVTAHLVTDGQATALPLRRNELLAPSVERFTVVTVGDEITPNARISAVASTADEATMTVSVAVEAQANDAALLREFTISHGSDVLIRDSVELSAGEVIERTYSDLAVPTQSARVLRVALTESDGLAVDDAVSVAIASSSDRRVVVAGFGERVPDAPGVYVRTALESGADAVVEVLAAASPTLPEDARHAVVFLDPENADAMAEVWRQTDRGVNVLVVPVPSRADGLNAGLSDNAESRVSIVDDTHPIGLAELPWFTVRLYHQNLFSAQPDDKLLVGASNGSPLLLEREGSRGRLLLLNDSLDGQVSNLPFEPVFVDVIRAVFSWFDAADAVPSNAFVGDSFVLSPRAQVFAPDGSTPGLATAESDRSVELRELGVYRVLDSRGERYVHVQIDPRESRLQRMSASDLDTWSVSDDRPGSESAATEPASERLSAFTSGQENTPEARPYWRWMLWVLAALVAIELVVGNHRLSVRRDGS